VRFFVVVAHEDFLCEQIKKNYSQQHTDTKLTNSDTYNG